ncbi:MAG: hypothetical protein MUF64_06965 [Polyangiaceae bacterium]|jgi:hypothetical protein|nr:hypothetical protein [Polyangiaceae bacterium]
MHELGHIASYVLKPYSNGGDYGWPSTGIGGGWSQNSSEWGATAFEEAFATHGGNITFWSDNSVAPTTCLSSTTCYSGGTPVGNSNIEATSYPYTINNCDLSSSAPESRWPVSAMRFLWDVFDNRNDADGDSYTANSGCFWCQFGVMGLYPSGTGSNAIDEPWNASYSAIDNYDGRGSASYSANYSSNFNSVTILRTDNCSPPLVKIRAMRYATILIIPATIFAIHCGEEVEILSKPSVPAQESKGGEGGANTSEAGGTASGVAGFDQAGKGGESESAGSGGSTVNLGICDGSNQLKLRMFIAPNYIGELSGSIVRVENGYPWFIIDGTCTYWMGSWSPSDPLARDRETRTGKLSSSVSSQLSGLPLGQLDSLLDCKTQPGSSDVNSKIIADQYSGVACIGSGPNFDKAWSIISTHADTLWTQGVAMDGNIRVSVYPASDGDNSKAYKWPLSVQISSLLVPESKSTSPGVSHVYQSSDASLLRFLRNEYLKDRGDAPFSFYDGQKFNDGQTNYYVYFRDVVPYEMTNGLLPFWPPNQK